MTTTPPEGAPWWAWLLLGVVGVVVPAIAAVTTAALNRPIKRTLKRVQEQTENEHATAEYPNLRDELTATRVAAENAAKDSAAALTKVSGVELSTSRLEMASVRHDQEISGTRGDIAALRSEHHETRKWVAAEAVERRRIGDSVGEVRNDLREHLGYALQRDEAIAELRAEVRQHHPGFEPTEPEPDDDEETLR